MRTPGLMDRTKAICTELAANLRLRDRSAQLKQAGRSLQAKSVAMVQGDRVKQLRQRAGGSMNRVGAAVGTTVDGVINRAVTRELQAEVEVLRERVDSLTRELEAERVARIAAEQRLAEVEHKRAQAKSPSSQKP